MLLLAYTNAARCRVLTQRGIQDKELGIEFGIRQAVAVGIWKTAKASGLNGTAELGSEEVAGVTRNLVLESTFLKTSSSCLVPITSVFCAAR